MLLSSLKTGRTDLRDTDVQQPNTAETFSLVISSRAFSANKGQFEAGSTTTASSFLPSRPPFLFCSSINISMTSFRVVSLIAMVPESECRMPTLIVSSAEAACAARPTARPAANANFVFPIFILVSVVEKPSHVASHYPSPHGWPTATSHRTGQPKKNLGFSDC